jgi:RNA polymerase sigma factor (sigma-70 family)
MMSRTARPSGKAFTPLSTLFDAGSLGQLSDDQLLERFVNKQDELAFEVIVKRHGPMILGMCLKATGDPHEAEDLFQATFIILARKARSIGQRDRLGIWLHGVARYAAKQHWRSAARRVVASNTSEHGSDLHVLAADSSPDDYVSRREREMILHEEIDRLPDIYRHPIKLCRLEGLTYEEAADKLGCSVNTIKSRLGRGLENLRGRLVRRGLHPTATVVSTKTMRAVVSVAPSEIAVPASLSQSTVSAAMRVMRVGTVKAAMAASGGLLDTGAVSAGAVSLAEAVLGDATRIKWLLGAKFAVAVAAALLVISVAGQLRHTASTVSPSFTQSAHVSSRRPQVICIIFDKPPDALAIALLHKRFRQDVSWVAVASGERVVSSGPQATITPHKALSLFLAARRAGDTNQRERALERKKAGRKHGVLDRIGERCRCPIDRAATPLMREFERYLIVLR